MDTTGYGPSRNGSHSQTASSRPSNREALSRVPCRFFNQPGGCTRGRSCWYLHDMSRNDKSSSSSDMTPTPSTSTGDAMSDSAIADNEELQCTICLEVPKKFGLMVNCSHVFCLFCIRKWRNMSKQQEEETGREGMNKTCPNCRKPTEYVIPSDTYHAHDTPGKAAELKRYLTSCAKIPCSNFTQSPSWARACPAGNKCLYAHLVDGNKYTFTDRELERMEQQRRRRLERRQQEMMFSELLQGGSAMAAADIWHMIGEMTGQNERRGNPFGVYGPNFGGDLWEDDDDDEDYQDEDEEEDDGYFDDEEDEDDELNFGGDGEDEIPALVSDDELPELVSDCEEMPALVSDDDAMPPLVSDDDVPDLVSDGEGPPVPDLVSDSDDVPELVSDDDVLPDLVSNPDELRGSIPYSGTHAEWRPTNTQSNAGNRQSHVVLSRQPPSSTRPAWGPTNAQQDGPNRPRVSLNSTSQTPNPTPRVSYRIFDPPIPAIPGIPRNPFLANRRHFSPPQHTPPPGRRRPRPPRSRGARHHDTSRPRGPPHPRATSTNDEVTWDDDENVTTETEGEISERERQRARERDERGINARNWDSRASDLSFFLS